MVAGGGDGDGGFFNEMKRDENIGRDCVSVREGGKKRGKGEKGGEGG